MVLLLGVEGGEVGPRPKLENSSSVIEKELVMMGWEMFTVGEEDSPGFSVVAMI